MGRSATNLHRLIYRTIPSQTKSWNGFPCLEWTGTVDKDGYGYVSFKDRTYRVSRLIASLYMDFDLNSPLLVCHHCDNPKYIEHRHFFIGTARQNTSDMAKKGRMLVYPNARHHNTEKTHCIRGHELSGSNLIMVGSTRRCAACRKFHNDKRKFK